MSNTVLAIIFTQVWRTYHDAVFPLRCRHFLSRLSNIIRAPREGRSVSVVALAARASCRWNVKNTFGYILNLRADSALHGAPGEDL